MTINKKKTALILMDLALLVYLFLAFTAFNKPEGKSMLCTKVNITVADTISNGFLNTADIKNRLIEAKVYPEGQVLNEINCRKIEDQLRQMAFVKTADCYKTISGEVNITITQLMPVVRILAENGEDYYIDDKDCIMQLTNTESSSDIIIATGNIDRDYATKILSPFARALTTNDLYRNLFEQINITSKKGVELVPRLGNHVVYLGKLPETTKADKQEELINEFVQNKLTRLVTFYKYGLSVAGWNKYDYINLEFSNQIICKKQEQ